MGQYMNNAIEGALAIGAEVIRGVKKKLPVDKKRMIVWAVIGVGTFTLAWMRDTMTKKVRQYSDK